MPYPSAPSSTLRRLLTTAWMAIVVAGLQLAGGPAWAQEPLVFLGDSELPPYEFLELGKPRGANVDLAMAIGKLLDRPVEVRLMDWTQAQSRFLAGEGTALTMLGRSPEREPHFLFSAPTVPVAFTLFVRADEATRMATDPFKGRRVGVTRGGLARAHLARRHPEAELVMVDNLIDGTRKLVRREIDALAAQDWSEYYLLSELGIQGVAGLEPFYVGSGNIALRKGDELLLSQIDGALAQLKSTGEFDRIMDKWSGTRVHIFQQSTLTALGVIAAVVLIALLLLSVALMYLRRQKQALAREIDERKRVENTLRETQFKLKAADRHKDEFLATLAHELRNPLAPISNAVRLLELQPGSDSRAGWAHRVIERQVDHLARLVDDLLDVSRISSGKLELRSEPVALHAVLGDAVDGSRPVIDRMSHRLALQMDTADVWLRADRVRLTQILSNLLTNAAKYMPAGGNIDLAATVADDAIRISVTDAGVGIPADQLSHVFEMFFQEGRSRSQAQGGLGIGLWLSQQLARMHGGAIEAYSAGSDQGSRFTLVLPATLVIDPPVEATAPDTESPAQRILVVDDNRDGAESLALLLEAMGHQVAAAFDGAQALEQGQALRPDCVFLDIGLPDISGFELCRRLRTTDWGASAKIVALTGWGSDADKQAATDAGFDLHLTKPAQAEDLERVLQPAA